MRRIGPLAVVAAGCAALLARPWLVRLPGDPVVLLVALFVVLGLVGAFWRLPAPASATAVASDEGPSGAAADPAPLSAAARAPVAVAEADPATDPAPVPAVAKVRAPLAVASGGSPVPTWMALGVGLGAFGVGRLLAVGAVPVAPFVLRSVALNSLAAVSEEAFFRRFAYGLAAVRGPAPAVVTSAAVFAAVHVTVWGWGVLPLDLAAGLVLGWQRWASGGWTVPAATHVAANVLAVW